MTAARKAGDPATAVKMYGNARVAPEYAAWPYRDQPEDRIARAARNVEAFRRQDAPPGTTTMIVRSAHACAGCHQR